MTSEDNHCTITARDFKMDKPARWCPGCGAHAGLAAVQRALPACGTKIEDVVFVSGIGCSSRFPYYINTYGFHGLHGRGAAIATGIKIANPELSVWLVTGDGDSMAIGGNHFIHPLRRNLEMMTDIFTQALQHKGTSLVEVLQNCVIFNDDIHAEISDKNVREDNQL